MIIWKPMVGEDLQCVEEPTNEVDNKNALAVILTEELVGHVQQKSP